MLRKPNSIPAGDTIVEDPVMEPFFISKSSSGGYTVYERVTKGDKNTKYIKTICYPSTFNSALKVVCKELLNTGNNHYTSVKLYMKEWKDIQEKMSNIANVD